MKHRQRLVEPLGLIMEWATPTEHRVIELFEHFPAHRRPRTRIENVVMHKRDLPLTVECSELHVVETSQGIYLPLEALLQALYAQEVSFRPILSLLRELSAYVSFHSHVPKPVNGTGLLALAAERSGFQMWTVIPGEANLPYVCIGWRPTSNSCCLFAGAVQFESSLGSGVFPCCEWVNINYLGIWALLERELRKIVPGQAIDLLTPTGIEAIRTASCGFD